jgi:hypothetical protein
LKAKLIANHFLAEFLFHFTHIPLSSADGTARECNNLFEACGAQTVYVQI